MNLRKETADKIGPAIAGSAPPFQSVIIGPAWRPHRWARMGADMVTTDSADGRGCCHRGTLIRGFADHETERVWCEEGSRRLPMGIQQRALNKLALLHRARRLEDLRVPPGNRLEALRGSRAGQHSIRVNAQWRICFRWVDGDALEVEICDYH